MSFDRFRFTQEKCEFGHALLLLYKEWLMEKFGYLTNYLYNK